MNRTLMVVIIILVAMTACGRKTSLTPAATAPAGGVDSSRTLTVDGVERSYLLHTPPGYDQTRPMAVVLVFHGGGGNAEYTLRVTDFNPLADEAGFLVVYPNGTGRRGDSLLTWNGGTCCAYAQIHNIDDVGFVRAIVADLQSFTAIDPKRIYATGMSNGGIMAYRLACEASDLIAAIGPVAGTQNFAPCQPQQPVSVIHFHGTADRNVPYEGGRGADSLVGVDFISVADSLQFWRDYNRCPPNPQRETLKDAEHVAYSGCAQGSAVELYTIIDGQHAWPGNQRPGWVGGDQPTPGVPASRLIWDFFAAHPKP